MNEPLVSVIVPTIGRPVFFQKALASVAAQTYPNLEIFVSDNAAEPAITEEEVRAACGGRSFRLVRRASRLSFAEHFNTCLREASGHYAMFLSDDDLLVPEFVAAAIACFESDPRIGAVMSQQTRIDETFFDEPAPQEVTFTVMPAQDVYLRWFRDGRGDGILTFVSLMGRRAEMIEAGGFGAYPSGAHSDIDMLLSITFGRKLGLLSGGFLYRIYPTSVGLGMPWSDLWQGTVAFEKKIAVARREGLLAPELHQALLRSHTTMMLQRYRNIYRKRPGVQNRWVPVGKIAGRILAKLFFDGPATAPILHRLFRQQ